jgi:N-acetylmuramoyl-L-alanine amidase
MKRLLFVFMCVGFPARAADPEPKVGERLPRRGDEIIVCGQLYHTTTRVVTWMDPGGYDAYRVDRRFSPDTPRGPLTRPVEGAPVAKAAGNAAERGAPRYSQRTRGLTKEQLERVRAVGWDLPLLGRVVDQFVIHFDARGTSRGCYEILQDRRGLSVHFMLDLDGTIYQTLDLKERAWHATKANDRSIGIEIANIGAYPDQGTNPLANWYQPDAQGRIRLVLPGTTKAGDPVTAIAAGLYPARGEKVSGTIHGGQLVQYDFTPQQYEALARLTATLCTVFPKIHCDYPRDEKGALLTRQLSNDEYDKYEGILGHFHVQGNKVDPGPAFQWDRVIGESRRLMAKP